MLAREITADLQAIRNGLGAGQSAPLRSKDIFYGVLTRRADGSWDVSGVEGLATPSLRTTGADDPPSLVIRPWHQASAVVSLREFTNNAMNHHHGMQSTERFGDYIDADLDGIANELTTGDMTAVAVFQALLPIPRQSLPTEPTRRVAALFGEQLFGSTGCGECHVPAMPLASRLFSEPNPYNPPGNLRPTQGVRAFAWDMTSQGPQPRLERDVQGAIVRAFTDLKRHNLCDADYSFYCNEQLTQGSLTGFAPASSFTVPPRPRPTAEFLTRKLWDVGNSDPYGHRGDLTTLTDAIYYHGGEARTARDAFFALPEPWRAAIIEFLKSLQVL
jgi:hypothetical protein